jgi:hypothetical protein
VTHLVGGHKQHVADDEFAECLVLLRREAAEARLIRKHPPSLFHSGVKHSGRRSLGEAWRRAQTKR